MMDAQATIRQAVKQDIRSRWFWTTPALALIGVTAILPLVVVLAYSFLAAGDYGDVKYIFSWDGWFNVLFSRDFFDDSVSLAYSNVEILARSVGLAFLTTILCILGGFPTAYFIATRPARSRSIWLFVITIPFWTNMLIRTFAIEEMLRNEGIVNWLLMRAGLISAPVQLLYTDGAVLLGMFYIFLPLMVLPLYSSMEKLDFRLVEAAYDLYASRSGMLWRVVIPLVKPGIIAGSVLVFIPALSSYVVPRLLGGGKSLMIGNLIELQFGQGRNWPLGSALSVTLVIMVFIAMLYVFKKGGKSSEAQHG